MGVPFRWSQEQLEFLTKNYPKMYREELTAAVNEAFKTDRTLEQVISALKNYKIKGGMPRRSSPKRLFTDQQLAFLAEKYLLMSRNELTKAFNAEFGLDLKMKQIVAAVKNHKIRSGRTGGFQKGHIPWTVGTKGKGILKPNSGTFRKGNTPVNVKPLYHERVDVSGFILIKVPERNPYTSAPTRYKFKHVWLWEQAHGPVPEDKVLVFRDGNKQNCCLENLMLVTRQELLRLNQHKYVTAPDELKPSILAVTKLECAVFAHGKKEK